jgi:tripartite-type tricarboxylate transporter receptor subunit TctC
LASAQAPARLLAGFPPGGGVDILARIFAERWSEAIGRAVIVENLPGAGGLIAMGQARNAPPDGSTLIVSTDSSLVIYPHTAAKPAYDTFADFTPVALTGVTVTALAVSTTMVPARDLAEFIAWARANPNQSSFGASGAGSALQFFGMQIARTLNIPLTHVPYKGVAPAIADVAGGQIAATVVPVGTIAAQVKAGRARLLGHFGSRRIASFPDVPTFKELGYAALESPTWFGIVGPPGMRPESVSRLNEMFVQAMRTEPVRERMARIDLEIQEMTPAQFAALIKRDYERWGQVVRASGWKPTVD